MEFDLSPFPRTDCVLQPAATITRLRSWKQPRRNKWPPGSGRKKPRKNVWNVFAVSRLHPETGDRSDIHFSSGAYRWSLIHLMKPSTVDTVALLPNGLNHTRAQGDGRRKAAPPGKESLFLEPDGVTPNSPCFPVNGEKSLSHENRISGAWRRDGSMVTGSHTECPNWLIHSLLKPCSSWFRVFAR